MMRDFKTAAKQFLDTVATFTSYELMDYSKFVVYTIFATIVALPRPELRSKVTRGAEILEVLHGIPEIKNYLFSLYECRYADFFKSLGRKNQIFLYSKDILNWKLTLKTIKPALNSEN